MKKKKLVLKTETVRQMQTETLSRVVGGTIIYFSYTCNATCYNCQYVNTAIAGGTKSMPATLCQTFGGGGGGGDAP